MKKTVSVRLSPMAYETLSRKARAEGRSRGNYITHMLLNHMLANPMSENDWPPVTVMVNELKDMSRDDLAQDAGMEHIEAMFERDKDIVNIGNFNPDSPDQGVGFIKDDLPESSYEEH